MKKKIISAVWFSLSLILMTAEMENMWLYLPLLANFVTSALFAKVTFKHPEICKG